MRIRVGKIIFDRDDANARANDDRIVMNFLFLRPPFCFILFFSFFISDLILIYRLALSKVSAPRLSAAFRRALISLFLSSRSFFLFLLSPSPPSLPPSVLIRNNDDSPISARQPRFGASSGTLGCLVFFFFLISCLGLFLRTITRFSDRVSA